MKKIALVAGLLWIATTLSAQTIVKLSADSVKITGTTTAGELIIQNHTRDKKGFLYNAGNGRTIFAPVVKKVNDTIFLVGTDTLRVPGNQYALLDKTDSILSVKTFNPTIYSATDTVAATIFNSSFVATTDKDTMVGVEFRPVKLLSGAGTTNAYAARFYDKVIIEGDINFYRNVAFTRKDSFYTNTWIRGADSPAMKLMKPSAASPELLVIQPTKPSTATTTMKMGLLFQDSVIFTAGTQDYAFIKAAPELRQQDGATGPLRGLYITPQLTGVTDFRGVQVIVNSGSGFAFYAPGTAPSRFGGMLQYLGNYNSGLTARTLIDKGYTDSLAGGEWYTGNNNSIYRTGNVAVNNKASATNLLAINGILLSKKTLVSATGIQWPDYVFDSSYVLMPLKEVYSYASKNKHLPGMPSAQTIEKEGIDVVDMQAALLKQVEELTLRLLNQQEKLQQQSEKILHLENISGGKDCSPTPPVR